MSDEQDAAVQMTPPEPEPAPTKPSGWPVALGVISVIFGSVATIQGCAGTVMPFLMGAIISFIEKSESNMPGMDVQLAQLKALQQHMGVGVGLLISISATLLAIMLLFGGIGLLKRRRWSVRATVTWAVLKLLYTMPYAWYSYVISNAQFKAMEEAAATSDTAPPAFLYSMMTSMAITFVILGVAWMAAYPVFVLVWFNRSRIKAETSGWNGAVPRVG